MTRWLPALLAALIVVLAAAPDLDALPTRAYCALANEAVDRVDAALERLPSATRVRERAGVPTASPVAGVESGAAEAARSGAVLFDARAAARRVARRAAGGAAGEGDDGE
jgi:hypothetical protein